MVVTGTTVNALPCSLEPVRAVLNQETEEGDTTVLGLGH